jgi:hypothetical protein
MVETITTFITGLPPVMQGVILCAGIIYAPQIFKWLNDKRNGDEGVKTPIENLILPELRQISEHMTTVNETLIKMDKSVMRHGDIQMSTGNKLNHLNEFMILVADRLKIDRPGS